MSNFGNNGIEDDGGVYSCCAINSKCKPDVLEAGNPQNCLLNLSSLSPGNSILEHVSQVTPEVDPSGDHVCPNTRGRELVRSQASNTLTFSAISIMLSARFSYNSAIHPRIFTGNKAAWVSVFITASLQVLITYVPGLNNIVFQMGPMIASQWGICMLFVFLTFILMEIEKAFMRFLKSRKHDTDDNFSGPEDVKDNDMTEPLVTTASQRSAALHQQLLKR